MRIRNTEHGGIYMRKAKNPRNGDNFLTAYFDQIKKIPVLTFEEELELSRRIQNGDEASRRRLIESNLRLVAKIARSFLAQDVFYMDLIQEGNIGLVRAVDKYDHLKQVRFSTYATWWIRQAIARSLTEKRRAIRLPRKKEEVLCQIQQSKHTLAQLYKRQPKTNEIAAEIGVSCEDVESVLGLTQSFAPLESEGDYTYNPEWALVKKSSREVTFQVLNKLNDRERNILIYRYQLNGGKRQSLKNIGDKMGLSTEAVRQIEFRALLKLRSHAEELRPYIEAM